MVYGVTATISITTSRPPTKPAWPATLGYDGEGRLNQTTLAGVITNLTYDGSELVAEYNSAGALLRRYVHGPGVDEERRQPPKLTPTAWENNLQS